MIKSKIDARERALELAVAQSKKRNVVHFDKNGLPLERDVLATAQAFETYLIGDAELPETQSDTELVKAFLEVMNSELEKKCKPNTPDYEEMSRVIQTSNAGFSAVMPCKLDVEY